MRSLIKTYIQKIYHKLQLEQLFIQCNQSICEIKCKSSTLIELSNQNHHMWKWVSSMFFFKWFHTIIIVYQLYSNNYNFSFQRITLKKDVIYLVDKYMLSTSRATRLDRQNQQLFTFADDGWNTQNFCNLW